MLTHLVASTHHHRQQLASLDDAAAELAPDMGEERAESKDQRAAPDRFWAAGICQASCARSSAALIAVTRRLVTRLELLDTG